MNAWRKTETRTIAQQQSVRRHLYTQHIEPFNTRMSLQHRLYFMNVFRYVCRTSEVLACRACQMKHECRKLCDSN